MFFDCAARGSVYESCRMGVAKPNSDFFRKTAQVIFANFGVSPEHTLLIDNNGANCDGARSIGQQAYLFDPSDPEGSIKRIYETYEFTAAVD